MTLCERIKLIDDMVKENPNATIKEYMELIGDIGKIEDANEMDKVVIFLRARRNLPGPVRTINSR
jgi:phosphopantetheine adenylyltransferase